jgi:hypothetical protein
MRETTLDCEVDPGCDEWIFKGVSQQILTESALPSFEVIGIDSFHDLGCCRRDSDVVINHQVGEG